MFLGIDHGTTAIRFATPEGGCWELPRSEASRLSASEIISRVSQNLLLDNVDLVALTYSMGDGLTRI
ncbi:MAG: methanogenesis marker 12 protein, partial [Methanothrix sp.]|nr:methanogenesis marker 12 protein [Methanothrix sp.]